MVVFFFLSTQDSIYTVCSIRAAGENKDLQSRSVEGGKSPVKIKSYERPRLLTLANPLVRVKKNADHITGREREKSWWKGCCREDGSPNAEVKILLYCGPAEAVKGFFFFSPLVLPSRTGWLLRDGEENLCPEAGLTFTVLLLNFTVLVLCAQAGDCIRKGFDRRGILSAQLGRVPALFSRWREI